jgi:hypothetical protein
MNKQLYERLELHPELENHIKAMLDVVEDVTGTLKSANDAEIKLVENMRKMNQTLLSTWASYQEKIASNKWKEENPGVQKHGKKKCIGNQLLVE